jgi:recombination protein RecA
MDANKQKALEAALGQIERQFGKGSIMRLGDKERQNIPAISTGSLGLDIALGIGGLPRGRVVEIYGPESSGKTTLALQHHRRVPARRWRAAFVDAEHALDPIYAEEAGREPRQPAGVAAGHRRTGAGDRRHAGALRRGRRGGDRLGGGADAQGRDRRRDGRQHVGLQARLMSQALRKITGNIKRSNTLVIFINQIRMKIGVMFGSPETTTGGNALKFYASVRLDIRRIGSVKDGDEVVGSETRVKVVKNKVAPPFRQAEFQIMYGTGIYRLGELVDMAVQQNLIEKSGAWYSCRGERIGQGKANAAQYLHEHPQLANELEAQIRSLCTITPTATDESADEP